MVYGSKDFDIKSEDWYLYTGSESGWASCLEAVVNGVADDETKLLEILFNLSFFELILKFCLSCVSQAQFYVGLFVEIWW